MSLLFRGRPDFDQVPAHVRNSRLDQKALLRIAANTQFSAEIWLVLSTNFLCFALSLVWEIRSLHPIAATRPSLFCLLRLQAWPLVSPCNFACFTCSLASLSSPTRPQTTQQLATYLLLWVRNLAPALRFVMRPLCCVVVSEVSFLPTLLHHSAWFWAIWDI